MNLSISSGYQSANGQNNVTCIFANVYTLLILTAFLECRKFSELHWFIEIVQGCDVLYKTILTTK